MLLRAFLIPSHFTVDREEVRKDLSAEKGVRGDNDVRWVEGEEDGWPPRPPRLRG